MPPIIVKSSNSRKSLRTLSARQTRRILSEVRANLRLQHSPKFSIADRDLHEICNTQDISSPLIVERDNSININVVNDAVTDESSSFSSDSDDDDTFLETALTESSFREHLASYFVDNNLTHIQCNNMLALLRTHHCFFSLPKDCRTLLNTPRNRAVMFSVEPGEYIHFDLETGIVDSLSNVSFVPIIKELKLDFNTDGCYLDKSGSNHIWPIQCRVVNIQYAKPIVVGIYKGAQKPYDPNVFFEQFILDIHRIMSSGGIHFHGNKIAVQLRCFIADAPTRAFILNHRGHMSSKPCSKCKVSGVLSEGRNVFNGINHPVRTDEEYIRCLDEDHHKEGKSPLSLLPIGMTSQVPFEYMHLVCLGVMKKLLSAWVFGKYSRLSKLSGSSISTMNTRLNILRDYCPSDFARRPRPLGVCSKYKATEYRQFLLYTGPVILYGLLNEQLYKHFLFLHTAVRILVSNSPSRQNLSFAELALQKFVLRCENLYGATFNSYNVHGILHITDDVRRFGNLDSFSAFPYENNMKIFRKYCRKPSLTLQQFFNRMIETRIHSTRNCDVDSSVRVSMPRNNDANCTSLQYSKIQFNKISLGTNVRDNCCILRNGSICVVSNIIVHNNSYRLVVKRFLEVRDFYNVGIVSSSLQVYKCATFSETFYVNLDEVNGKCYRMPFWDCTFENDSDSDGEHLETPQYIVAVIVHSERM